MRGRRKSEALNLAFLDIMSCGLGAVVLVFMLVKHNAGQYPAEADLLAKDLRFLELEKMQMQQTLLQLQNIAQLEEDKKVKLREKKTELLHSLSQQRLALSLQKDQLADMKRDISTRPVAEKEDLIEDVQGGEENYLIGLKVAGPRIVVLIDSSSSMTDESLIEIIKRKNGSEDEKKRGPKWQRTKKAVRWLLGRVPKTSQLAVLAFNSSVTPLGGPGWKQADSRENLQALYRELDSLVPEGATNLQKGLQAAAGYGATDLYLVTDGLPTIGESRYASLNPFTSCSSLLGKSSTISGECRVKLFRQSVKDSKLGKLKVNVVLLPIEGDPDAVNEYWTWSATSGGLLISPALNWP